MPTKPIAPKPTAPGVPKKGIRLAGIGPGRPPKDPAVLHQRLEEAKHDEAARQPSEGVFGRAKRRWGRNHIMTRRADTALVAIALVFLVMNMTRLLAPIFIPGLSAWVVYVLFLLALRHRNLCKMGISRDRCALHFTWSGK